MDVIRPGAVCGERLRLEKPLSSDAVRQVWLATDLRTGSLCSVEFLPADSAASEDIIHLRQPNLLSFYRFENMEGVNAAVSAFHPLLEAPSLQAVDVAAVRISTALTWFVDIACAVAGVHEAGHRPHGAISPTRIRASASDVLLTGYPYSGAYKRGAERSYISPERKATDGPPSVSDDIFALAAIAYFLFSGGCEPPSGEYSALRAAPDIDTMRRNRGLAPTGWPSGWDKAVFSGLAPLPSLRPSSARLLAMDLAGALGDVLRLRSQRSKRTARPVLTRSRFGAAWSAGAQPFSAPAPQVLPAAMPGGAKWSDAMAEAERLRDALTRQQELLAADLLRVESDKAAAERKTAELQAERAVLEDEKARLDVMNAQLARQRASLEDDRNDFETAKIARLMEREAQLGRCALELAQERTRSEAALSELARQRTAMDVRIRELQAMEHDIDKRQEELRDLQRGWAGLCESEDPDAWKGLLAKTVAAEKLKQPLLDDSPPANTMSATLVFSNGRRLHIFSGRVVRFGRHAQSDFVLIPMIRGQHQPVVMREISRKHFEVQVAQARVTVRDGWSDEGKPSQHGVCIDGRRVTVADAELADGALLSVTTRPPGRLVPHWRVKLLFAPQNTSSPLNSTAPGLPAPRASLSAVYLRRMDDAPGDVCILTGSLCLRDAGFIDAGYSNATLKPCRGGILWELNGDECLLTDGATPYPGVSAVSSAWLLSARPETSVSGASSTPVQ